MQRRLQSESLKGLFATAWYCLPAETRHALIHFIRQVREVDSLESATIRCPDGRRVCLLKGGDSFTFLYRAGGAAFCDILLSAELAGIQPHAAVGIILYELAHAHAYLVKPEEPSAQSQSEADQAAWDQAICWARAGIPALQFARLVEFGGLVAKMKILADRLQSVSLELKKGGCPA
jgi:hypothetical protein